MAKMLTAIMVELQLLTNIRTAKRTSSGTRVLPIEKYLNGHYVNLAQLQTMENASREETQDLPNLVLREPYLTPSGVTAM
jgi:hypothetical protein